MTAATRLAAATPTRLTTASAAIESAATTCPAEMLERPNGSGTASQHVRLVESEGTK